MVGRATSGTTTLAATEGLTLRSFTPCCLLVYRFQSKSDLNSLVMPAGMRTLTESLLPPACMLGRS